jgi:hypothetical protein
VLDEPVMVGEFPYVFLDGLIILDLVDDRIVHVEVLYRDDVRSKLTQLFA